MAKAVKTTAPAKTKAASKPAAGSGKTAPAAKATAKSKAATPVKPAAKAPAKAAPGKAAKPASTKTPVATKTPAAAKPVPAKSAAKRPAAAKPAAKAVATKAVPPKPAVKPAPAKRLPKALTELAAGLPEKPWLSSYSKNMPAEIGPLPYGSIGDFLVGACKQFAGQPAFVCMGKAITYAELEQQSAAFGAYLQSKGLQKGARVALMMPNVLQYPVAMMAVLRAGFTVVNVNP
ncbi:long-chain fatty acid--CoA ligase, partial [Mesorhizobium sp. M4B.F.Ca.ET.088.02.2.1]